LKFLVTHEWRLLPCTGDIPAGKDGYTLFLYDGNQMILFGGRKANWLSTNDVHCLDLVTYKWTLLKPVDLPQQTLVPPFSLPPCPRTDHGAILLTSTSNTFIEQFSSNPQLLVFGGYNDGYI